MLTDNHLDPVQRFLSGACAPVASRGETEAGGGKSGGGP